jgi:acetolactate synthase I/II/III large subunit
MNGAESLVETLLASDVNVCFANPGTSEMHFVTALDQFPDMRCILCLFEGGTSGAADGYFRMSGKVAATLLHLAPGFGNAFSNLHNARKAHSGIVNVMGDHATYHVKYETPLKGNTLGISQAISHWTRVSDDATQVATDGAEAVRAARSNGGQIATLILPANTAWEEAVKSAASAPPPKLRLPLDADVAAAAQMLKMPGAALMIDGRALFGEQRLIAARIAKATGCRLMCPFLVSRVHRGVGSLLGNRMAYRLAENMPVLSETSAIVLCGADRPVTFFAYPGKQILPEPPNCRIFDLCGPEMDYIGTLEALADNVGTGHIHIGPEDLQQLDLPSVPTGTLNAEKVGQAIAALMPENCIVVDEAVSSSRHVVAATMGARQHDWLNITGGSIGWGLAAAVGAAVACPDRKVIAIEGDGSAMYGIQALWTMARENLDVTTVIFSNRGYRILHAELDNLGVEIAGLNSARLFDIAEPCLDFVALARGHGVEGLKASTTEEFAKAFGHAMKRKGPILIEAII